MIKCRKSVVGKTSIKKNEERKKIFQWKDLVESNAEESDKSSKNVKFILKIQKKYGFQK